MRYTPAIGCRKEVMAMCEYRNVFKRKEIKYLLNAAQYEEIMAFMGTMAEHGIPDATSATDGKH